MKPSEIVAKFKEVLLSASDEVELQEPEVKEEVEMMPEEAPKAESVSKEDFDKLKAEFASLKGMVEKMANTDKMEEEVEVPAELESEVKKEVKEELSAEPIVHTPEVEVSEKKTILFSQNREETTLERIFNQINKK
jgi:hypothetical protein